MKNFKTLVAFAALILIAGPVLAQEGTVSTVTDIDRLVAVARETAGWFALAAGLGIALAAFGGATAQGKAAAAALEGIARNPAASGKLLVPLVLSLALIESLIIFTLLIAFNITGSLSDVLKPILALAAKATGN